MSLNSLQKPSNAMSQVDVYTDLSGLQKLKVSARKDSQAAIPEVAKQFEALMISMMIKNMRKTGMEDPIFKSQAMDSYQDMYDQQLGMELSKGEGIGFARAIAEQIKYQAGNQQSDTSTETSVAEPLKVPQRRHFPTYNAATAVSTHGDVITGKPLISHNKPVQSNTAADFNSPQEFVQKLWPLAEKAAQKLGVSPEVILSQAALETGWGQHIISKNKNSSFNLFNIKASQDWSGSRMAKVSHEFINDDKQHTKLVQQKSDFKAYSSYAQSFADYVELIRNNSRYNGFVQHKPQQMNKPEQFLHDKNYIKGLHKAGYATDPKYADKILNVLKSDAMQNHLNETTLALK